MVPAPCLDRCSHLTESARTCGEEVLAPTHDGVGTWGLVLSLYSADTGLVPALDGL